MKARRKVRRTEHLVLAPALDVVFQLVLFLLATSAFQMQPAITMSLPKSSTARGTDSGGVVISLTAEGALSLNGSAIAFGSLGNALSLLDPRRPVAVEADSSAANGTVVFIFDELRKAGFTEVHLRTRGL